jgi:UDP-N-acetylglucosamine--N-acetylmuramyl-(pentapeptide) pyrophosphoryl-undecaprenol N-acetylglucosamine transferase
VLTFGSYIAVPVAFSAFICRIPIITHEQTIQPGLANIVISRIARIICVSFPETVRAFSKKKTILTGLPIRKEILEPQKKDFFPTDNPILYITGGSLGSSSMNALLFPLIHDFIKTYTVIHQTGAASYGPASEIRQSLPITLRNRYVIQQYVDTEPAAWVLHKAEAVITRAGANTVIELAYLHKRAILIPLPWAGAGEQEKHARWFCNREIGRIIDQKKAIPSDIIHALTQITGEENRITSSVSPVPADGARRVIDIVSAVLLQPDDKHA